MPDCGRRCGKCVLPETARFALDARGTCKLCTKAAREASSRPDLTTVADALESRIEEIRRLGKDRPFDCVVGLSGGRDSTYLLHLLVRKHRLRCLAAYYRTPFTSSVTDANVRRTVETLGVSLTPIAISTEEHRRVAKAMLLGWIEAPDPIVAHMMCAPCKLVNRELFKIARANAIRTLVWGANKHEAVQIAVSVGDDVAIAHRARLGSGAQLRRTLAIVKHGTVALARSTRLARHLALGVQASVMYLHPHTPYLRLSFPDVQAMEYFYYSHWDQAECEGTLSELGWQLPPGCNSSWKSDCSFAEVKNVVFKKMTGTTYLDFFLSNMVRAGALQRDEALRRLEVEGALSRTRLRDACEILGVSEDRVLGATGWQGAPAPEPPTFLRPSGSA